MAFALSVLRWSPDVFWRATPRELATALGGPARPGAAPVTRRDLARLMRVFPDRAVRSDDTPRETDGELHGC